MSFLFTKWVCKWYSEPHKIDVIMPMWLDVSNLKIVNLMYIWIYVYMKSNSYIHELYFSNITSDIHTSETQGKYLQQWFLKIENSHYCAIFIRKTVYKKCSKSLKFSA